MRGRALGSVVGLIGREVEVGCCGAVAPGHEGASLQALREASAGKVWTEAAHVVRAHRGLGRPEQVLARRRHPPAFVEATSSSMAEASPVQNADLQYAMLYRCYGARWLERFHMEFGCRRHLILQKNDTDKKIHRNAVCFIINLKKWFTPNHFFKMTVKHTHTHTPFLSTF